jgi:DNA-binding GntR family transcriptional regulator
MTFQYQRLAEQLAQRIYQHELQPQQKLSSLREFARQQCVSLSTAQQCYELLEAKGLIYVKAKSGYFVSSRQYQSAALSMLPQQLIQESYIDLIMV